MSNFRVFISYAKKDTYDLALALADAINSIDGLQAWVDRDLKRGSSWAREIERQIDACDLFLLLISPDVNRQPSDTVDESFVITEIHRAKYICQPRKPILPIMVQRTKPPIEIGTAQYLDVTRKNHADAIDEILADVHQQAGMARPYIVQEESDNYASDKNSKSTPKILVGSVIGALLIITIIIGILLSSGDDSKDGDTATPTWEVAGQPSATQQVETPNIEATANYLDTLDAQTVIAAQTQTAAAYTDTPSPTPTDTPNYDASTEALRNQRATQTRAAMPVPTATFTLPPTLSPREVALQGVSSSDEWIPYSEPDEKGIEMVLVPAGTFTMGSTEDEIDYGFELCQQAANENGNCQRSWYEDEAPTSQQTMTAFWIDQYEVTRAAYQACVDAGECEATPDSEYSTEDNQPINRITWFQAQAYCEWRGGRLPTEAEWEYAARGPDGLLFPWGNTFDSTQANHCDRNCGESDWASEFNYVNEEYDDGYTVTAPVGSYPQGAAWVGALDMSGNVWEWTNSLFQDYPYVDGDGREADTGDSTDVLRVLRGGSFSSPAGLLRAAYRYANNPDLVNNYFGMRCLLSY